VTYGNSYFTALSAFTQDPLTMSSTEFLTEATIGLPAVIEELPQLKTRLERFWSDFQNILVEPFFTLPFQSVRQVHALRVSATRKRNVFELRGTLCCHL